MFCGKCGAKLEENDRFCSNCGEPRYQTELLNGSEGPASYPGEDPCGAGGEGTVILDPPVGGGTVPGDPWGGDDGWDSDDPGWDGKDSWSDVEDEPEHEVSGGCSPMPAHEPLKRKPTMDPSERHELVIITRAEAISGCRKIVEIDGSRLVIDIPPNFTARDSMVFPGYGYPDPATGERGKLKVQFLID